MKDIKESKILNFAHIFFFLLDYLRFSKKLLKVLKY